METVTNNKCRSCGYLYNGNSKKCLNCGGRNMSRKKIKVK